MDPTEPPQLEDYRFYGTELDQLRQDARGQKRLHGAFTGGFMAGYDNTVGSAYGWQPSREKTRKQSVEDFLDDDELEAYNRKILAAKSQYDTFGLAAKDAMTRDLERAADGARSLLVVPSVVMAPVAQGIGVRLLLRMGWRRGKSVQCDFPQEMTRLVDHAKSVSDLDDGIRKELCLNDTEVVRIEPKLDSFGLGYDPYKGAEEFRTKKATQGWTLKSAQSTRQSDPGIAFGTGVINDDDDIGILDDYVTHDPMALTSISNKDGGLLDASGKPMTRYQGPRLERLGDRLLQEGYNFEIQDVEENDDGAPLLLGGRDGVPLLSDQAVDIVASDASRQVSGLTSILAGFVVANDNIIPMTYPRPLMEQDFVPRVPTWITHKSSLSMPRCDSRRARDPCDPERKRRIDEVALQVARSGADFEGLVKAKDSFVLPGDTDHDYYIWKVNRYMGMISRGHTSGATSAFVGAPPRLAIEERSQILGEKRLEEDRKKMGENMAAKFVRAGDAKGALSEPNMIIQDMSKRPPVVRSLESWTPLPLLCRRLDIDRREHNEPKKTTEETRHHQSRVESQDAGGLHLQQDEDALLAANTFLDKLLAEAPPVNAQSDRDELPPALPHRPLDLFQSLFEEGEEDMGYDMRQSQEAMFMPVAVYDSGNRVVDKNSPGGNETRPDPKRERKVRPPSSADAEQATLNRAALDDKRIRKALRVLDKEKRRKEKKRERQKRRERKDKEKVSHYSGK